MCSTTATQRTTPNLDVKFKSAARCGKPGFGVFFTLVSMGKIMREGARFATERDQEWTEQLDSVSQQPPSVFDFRGAVDSSISSMFASGKVDELVAKASTKCVEGVINDLFAYHGDIAQQLKTQIKDRLAISDIGVARYNATVMNIIRTVLDGRMESLATIQIKRVLDDLVADPPETIKVSEIVTAFVDQHKGDFNSRERGRFFFFFLGQSHDDCSALADYWHIGLDDDPKSSKFSCRYRISFNKSTGKITGVVLDRQDLDKKIFVSGVSKFGALLFSLHAAKTTLVIDETEDDVDTEWPESEEE